MTETKAKLKSLRGACGEIITSIHSLKHLAAAALGAATLLTTGTASATLVDAIDALAPGDMYRVVFMTNNRGLGNLDDIGVYNQRVTDAASAGSVTNPLGLSWSALASTVAVNAQTNTGVTNGDNSSVSFFNTLGDLVAVSGVDLWDGSLLTAILADENGGTGGNASGEFGTWTGTDSSGVTSNPLVSGVDGNLDPIQVNFGNANVAGSGWMTQALNPNDFSRSLYGVSSKVTIPDDTSVPEPTTLALVGIALFGTVLQRRRIRSAGV
jgi:hypothetical protein